MFSFECVMGDTDGYTFRSPSSFHSRSKTKDTGSKNIKSNQHPSTEYPSILQIDFPCVLTVAFLSTAPPLADMGTREKYCAVCGCHFSLPDIRDPVNPDPDENALLPLGDPYDSRMLPQEMTEVRYESQSLDESLSTY